MAYDWSGETIKERRIERLTIIAMVAVALIAGTILVV
jgi:hypothetical protein